MSAQLPVISWTHYWWMLGMSALPGLCFWFIIFLDRISRCRLKGSTQVASEFHLCFLWLVWPCWFHPAWAGEVHIQLLNNENEHQSLRPWSLAAVVTSTYHTVWVYFFLSLFSSDSKQLLYHLLTKSVTFSIMCWRNKINKMKSYTSKEINFFVFFSPGKETYQSKVSVEMRRLSWATPPFHTVFAVHLNNFTKCSVSCFVFTRAPKNANLSTVKNIAIFTHFF